ncbi:MAG TPA: hypothetical protein DEB40_10405 [Elusimicrobia bacterium]|nr:hypothetical protein [Elusimicrobiota bacterium]HBT62141.1 hypothetical protein [Elusimicrobiota bacterium]
MPRKAELSLIALLGAYLAVVLCRNLALFPGLHGDEAWVGLYALRIRAHGIFSAHEMNTYTGPLYGWLLAKIFSIWRPSVLSLRLPGTLLNLAAAWLMAWHLGRAYGRRSALAWLGLLCSCAIFVLKSRVAWEVYALQNFLLACIIILAHGLLTRQKTHFMAILAFMAANFCGVLNHFIFLSVPLSLFISALANMLYLRDWPRIAFFRLCSLNLIMAGTVYLIKPIVTESFWESHGSWLGPAALLWPLVWAALFKAAAHGSTDRVRHLFETSSRRRVWFDRVLLAALGLGLALFFLYHWIALMQIWSGVAVFERLASWRPPWWLVLGLYAWAAALLGLFFSRALQSLTLRRAADYPPHERFLLLWPLIYCATFILLRNTNSIRYYVIPSFLLTMALSWILPRSQALRRRRFFIPMLAGAILLNVCFWRETSGPSTRRPIRFYVGWHLEKSIDFADNAPVLEAARRERVCRFPRNDSFTDLPLIFQLFEPGYACDRSKAMFTRFCWECPRPPYFQWQVRTP